MDKIKQLSEMICECNKIVFLGGAGVSTESGIPDFRSENGIFEAIQSYGYSPEVLLSRTFFNNHTEVFFEYYKKNLLITGAMPNKAHYALSRLEKMGKLTAIITQNIDNLHQAAGSKNVLELHGSTHRNYCVKCHKFFDMDYVKNSVGIPYCDCGGLIKPDVVLYEESLDSGILRKAVKHLAEADMLIVGGTSLVVYPAAGLVEYFGGDKRVIINKSETSWDNSADLVISDSIGKVLSEAVGE